MSHAPQDPPQSPTRPAPLTAALSLVAVEALVFVVLAVAELAALESAKLTMGLTTALFFVLYGAGLGACAWAASRLRSWARAPIVLAQLIQLAVAWSFWGGETTWVAVALGVVALVVLAGIFHPDSLDALGEED